LLIDPIQKAAAMAGPKVLTHLNQPINHPRSRRF
jgi:hypothetical protein